MIKPRPCVCINSQHFDIFRKGGYVPVEIPDNLHIEILDCIIWTCGPDYEGIAVVTQVSITERERTAVVQKFT